MPPVGVSRGSTSRAAAGLVLAAALLLSPACATINPPWQLAPPGGSADASVGTPAKPVHLADVPFYPQDEYQCGPAALATVLVDSGVSTSPEALVPQVYLPGREGSLQLELVAAMRRAGRIPYVVEPTTDALLAELHAGRPVLVLQNLLVRSAPRWHYAVLVGTDPERNEVILNSGTERGLQVAAPKFLRTWDWAGRWGLLALRPGELPAHAEAVDYLAAVADFEAVAGAEAAAPAYRAAIERWPDDPRTHLALGNHAYGDGEHVEAAAHYRGGLALAPNDPVLGNNYASVLGELGCTAEARAALEIAQAGATEGRWREQLAQTAAELASSKAERSPSCQTLTGAP
ncbi:PA2778 family cysteine peptidase [Novilysobacter erysipheiresistens]|uniref:PA2778 family cysteine peptidase n=1 Tax=Novilysobacter erysipheiresistens TaxID=1749332 RepID=A0ABU7Z1U6_9GAMM